MSTRGLRVRVTEPGGEGDKKHTSMWFVTANTNAPATRAEAVAFWERVKSLGNDPAAWIKPNYGREMDPTAIIDIQLGRLEFGNKYHKLHIHIVVTCNHNSNVRIDAAYLRRFLGTPYVNVKFMKEAADPINKARYYSRK